MKATHILILASALLIAGCKGNVKDVSGYIASAEQYTAAGDAAKAREQLQMALRAQPGNPVANAAMGKNREASGDLEGAIPYYVRAAQPDARLVEPQLRIISILVDGGRLRDALGRSNLTVGSFPNNADALALRADIEERQAQPGLAQRDVQAALGLDPRNARAIAVSARLRLREGDVASAQSIIQQGLRQRPDDISLLQVDAAIELALKQPQRALAAFRVIAKERPRNANAQRALADLQVTSGGSLDDAIENFHTSVEANPENQEMQVAFVDFLAEHARNEDSIAYLRKLIAKSPTDDTYDLMLAQFYTEKGDVKQAYAVFADASKRLGDTPAGMAIQVASAKLDLINHKVEDAKTKLAAVLAADPENADALLARSAIEIQAGQMEQAITDLLTVVGKNPLNSKAFAALAAAYVSVGQPAQAVDAMRHSVAVSPGDDNANLRLAVFLQANRAFAETKELLARLTAQYPNLTNLWVLNARLAIERGDWDMASQSLARLRNLPDTEAQVNALDGELRFARGDFDKAYASLKAAVQDGRFVDAPVVVAFAKASAKDNKVPEAMALLTGKIPSMKDDSLKAALTALVAMNSDTGHPQQAEAAFRNLVQLDPVAAAPRQLYANILISQKLFDQADQVAAQGLSAGAPRGDMMVLHGLVAEARGNRTAAFNAYKAAVAANAYSVEAANNYGSMLADLAPKDTEALTKARDALNGQEGSGNPAVVDTIAWLDYRLQRFGEAKLLLQRIDAAHSQNAQLRFHLAAVLLASGDRPGGLALLGTLKGIDFPGSDEARDLSAS